MCAFKMAGLDSQILCFHASATTAFETGEEISLVSFAPSCFSEPVICHCSNLSSSYRDGLVLERGEDAFENPFAVVAAEDGFAGAFGMRHQAGHVALFITDAGDVLQRAVGIRTIGQVSVRIAILPEDLVVGLELCERFLVGKITAFAMGDGHAQDFSRRNLTGEWRIVRGGLEENIFAVELQIAVADERAGQQAGFGEDLKAVADAEDEAAVVGELFHGLHHGAEPRDRAAAKIIAIAEAAGKYDTVGVAERSVLVPDKPRGMAEVADGVNGILVAVAGGKLEDGEVHVVLELAALA